MLGNIEVLCHSSIKISKDKVIYIDPFKINKEYNDADYIFITHDHYDHFSIEDISKVIKDTTMIIMPENVCDKAIRAGIKQDKIVSVVPEDTYTVDGLSFGTVLAYNNDKDFHPKENNWVGYIIYINSDRYYIAGDTDMTDDNMKVKCDVAFVPVGGTYTMTYKEAAELVNNIKPKIAVPTHYGSIVGSREDADNFIKLLDKDIEPKILIK